MEYNQSELNEFKVSQSNTSISFLDNTLIKIEGGLSDLLKDDELLMGAIKDVLEMNIRDIFSTEPI